MNKKDSDRMALITLNDSDHSYKLNQLIKEIEDSEMKIFFAMQLNEFKKMYEKNRCFWSTISKTEWDGDPSIKEEVSKRMASIRSQIVAREGN